MRVLYPLVLTLLVVSTPSLGWADDDHRHQIPDPAARDWLQGLTLVTTTDADIGTIHAARVAIQQRGGRVGLFTPAGLLMATFPPELDGALLSDASIASIHREPVNEVAVAKQDPEGMHFARSFNSFVSGEYQQKIARDIAQKGPPQPPANQESDAFLAPPLEEQAYLQNLTDAGLNLGLLEARGLLETAANHKADRDIMSGTISVTIFLAESDGSIDPDIYTWNNDDVQSYINGVNSGLLFWSERADDYGCWAAFMVRFHDPTDVRCHQSYEPILHSSSIATSMISEIMANFGYTSGGSHSRVAAYNTWQCATYGTDRAYSAFVGYNPVPAGDQFTNGSAAWAFFYGPYTFLLYRSYSWAPDQVFTHETGHIFGGCDEYSDSGCGCSQVCNNAVPLGNCENCAGFAACMMASNTFTICQFTDGHVGWRMNPCSPPALPGPSLVSISPNSAKVGTSADITLTGQDFFVGTFLDLGEDVTVEWTEFVDPTTVIVTVSIDGLATPGFRDITAVNRDLQTDTLALGFDVIPTPRHYMSADGNDVYPYLTPADAANTLAHALTAAGPGDSVLVDLAPLTNVQLNVTQDIEIQGGWTNNFQTRNPTDRTPIDLSSNFKVQGNVTLESLELHGGFGLQEFSPINGVFGGAVTVRNASLTVRNCHLHDNVAPVIPGTGGGGAIYAFNSTLEVYDSTISGNTSHHGGAIYMRNSSGTISGSTISGNSLTHPTSDTDGAAIYMVDSSGVLIEDNLIDANLNADHGGAIYATNSTGITVRGGTISNSSAGFTGGAIALLGSDATVENVTFDTNQAVVQGGAIYVDASSGLVATGNTFRGNSAQLGGAIHQTTAPAAINHNTFDTNTAQFSGSAIFLNTSPSGDILGNTLSGNLTSVVGGAAIALSASAPTVQHNIIAGSSHVGVFCSGAPSFGFNLYHGNGGGDLSGCSMAPSSRVGDPWFVDTASGDFHLGLDSAGIDAAETGGGYDDPDGSRGDLGIYGTHSFTMDQPSAPQNVAVDVVGSDVNVSWNANSEGDLASYAIYGDAAAGFIPDSGNRLALVAAPNTSVNLGPRPGVTHIKMSAVDTDGYAGGYSAEAAVDTQTPAEQPEVFVTRLLGNIPNPFNPSTRIHFEVATAGPVELLIYDVTGRAVRTLVHAQRDAGRHQVSWDGRDDSGSRVASGVYFNKLVTGGTSRSQKMTLLK